jgi:NTP pyrophosphatase (non-canonical NTP hydrolase)
MSDYRKFVLKTSKKIHPEDEMTFTALRLVINSSEFADLITAHQFQKQNLNKEQLVRKLGDVRWFLEYACHILGVTMEEVENKNIERVKLRLPEEFD